MNALAIAAVIGITLLLASVFIDRVLVSFRARRTIQQMLNSKTNPDPRVLEDPKHGTLAGDGECLRIRNAQNDSAKLLWSDIEEVHALKRDLFSTDLICLTFKKSGKEEYYEIHEEMAGYHDLLKLLPNRLPGFNLEWFSSVAFPAFATNHQIIWKRSLNQPPQATGAPSSS